jgi:hypothetical protein
VVLKSPCEKIHVLILDIDLEVLYSLRCLNGEIAREEGPELPYLAETSSCIWCVWYETQGGLSS